MTTALYFTSERELPRNNAGVWNSCRIVSVLTATSLATHNQCILRGNDRHMGPAGRIALCMKGLRGADGNWRADSGFNQGDIDEIHAAMFPGLPMPTLVGTTDWQGLIDHLPTLIESGPNKGKYTDGQFISISARLSALPLSDDARKWTSADHQFVLRAKRGTGAAMQLKRVDPMRPKRQNYQGDWVDASSVRKAAKAINGGVIIAELYGDWTAKTLDTARLRTKLRNSRIATEKMTTMRDNIRERLNDAKGELAAARLAVLALTEELEDCGKSDCDDELDGQAEAIADRVLDLSEEIRNIRSQQA